MKLRALLAICAAWFVFQCGQVSPTVHRSGLGLGVWLTHRPSKFTATAYHDKPGKFFVVGGYWGHEAINQAYYLAVTTDGLLLQWPGKAGVKQKDLVKWR